MNQKIVSIDYNTIVEDCNTLYTSFCYDNPKVKYDAIIGIGRGGLIPATLLSYKFNIPVFNYGIKSYTEKKKRGQIFEYQYPDIDYGTTVILIDDLADSGKSFEYCLSELAPLNLKITTAALYIKTNAKFIPDYFIKSYASKEWISFPWEQ